jgi:hypothetical protein
MFDGIFGQTNQACVCSGKLPNSDNAMLSPRRSHRMRQKKYWQKSSGEGYNHPIRSVPFGMRSDKEDQVMYVEQQMRPEAQFSRLQKRKAKRKV